MKYSLLLCALLGACGQKAAKPTPPASSNTAGGGGNGAEPGASGAGTAAEAGAAAEGGQPAAPDSFDDSGCVHPQVEAQCSGGWCMLPAGCFVMGSPDSEWEHAP